MSLEYDQRIFESLSNLLSEARDNLGGVLIPGDTNGEQLVSAIGLGLSTSNGIVRTANWLASNLGAPLASNPANLAALNNLRSALGGLGLGLNVAVDAYDLGTAIDSGDYNKAFGLSKIIGYKIGYATLFATAATITGAPLLPAAAIGYVVGGIIYQIIQDLPLYLDILGILFDFLGDLFYQNITSPLISWLRDPLTLDLDGDGIELISLANSTTHFDLDGNGFAERTGWVAGDDGMLVRDGNRNGQVDSVAELFGSPTQDGFAVLETYDQNHDGKIDASDAVFRDLKVWRDLNQDGVSQSGELFTLSQLGIQSISVSTQDATGTNQGHGLGVTGLFTRQNGTTGRATSIYFQTDGQDSTPNETGFTPAAGIDQLPQLPRSGNLHSIAWMATNDADFRADLTALVNNCGAPRITCNDNVLKVAQAA